MSIVLNVDLMFQLNFYARLRIMSELFSSHPLYAWTALIGTSFFLIKVILSFVGGDADFDGHADALDSVLGGDVDASAPVDAADSFVFFSIQSMLAFLMGFGWVGLICRSEYGLGHALTIPIATGTGALLFLLNASLTIFMSKLNTTNEFDIRSAIGKEGKVYLTLPKNGEGKGQVEVEVNCKKVILNAISFEEQIKSFEPIEVISEIDHNTVLVDRVKN